MQEKFRDVSTRYLELSLSLLSKALLRPHPIVEKFVPDDLTQIINNNLELWERKDQPDFNTALKIRTSEISARLIRLKGDPHTPPKVSIIIPAYNEEKNILQVLDSISRQYFQGGIEVIIVDNNSRRTGETLADGTTALKDDLTAKLAEECGARVIEYYYPEIPYYPIVYARQKGLEQARGTYVLSTDADVVVGPDWVRSMIEPLENDGNISLVAGDINYFYSKFKGMRLVHFLNQQYRRRAIKKQLEGNQVGWANIAARKVDMMETGWDLRLPVGDDIKMVNDLRRFGKLALANSKALIWTSARRFNQLSWPKIKDTLSGKFHPEYIKKTNNKYELITNKEEGH